MPKLKVLVTDDAVAIRRLVSDVLETDPEIEVVGTAATGAIALSKIRLLQPDVVTLDVEMPEMDGLTALAAIRETYPSVAVIMLSSYTDRGAAATLEALIRGASDYVAKPAQTVSREVAVEYLRTELLPRVKAVGGVTSGGPGGRGARRPPVQRTAPSVSPRPPVERIDIVAIGVSTGGPTALARLLADIPAGFPAPMVIVQHMPPLFTSMLAERLRTVTAIDLREAKNGDALTPGTALLAPGDHHMILRGTPEGLSVGLHKGPPENSCRPSVDVLLRSVAEVCGAHALTVIMTGMGHDGLVGCQAVSRTGGRVLAQDESSSVVWGMPRAVVEAGLADAVLPLDRLGAEIVGRVVTGRPRASTRHADPVGQEMPRCR